MSTLTFLSRSEVSSSSSSASPGQSGKQLSVQVLLHSQGLQASSEQDQQDCEILSSQEDLFDADKTGTFTYIWYVLMFFCAAYKNLGVWI